MKRILALAGLILLLSGCDTQTGVTRTLVSDSPVVNSVTITEASPLHQNVQPIHITMTNPSVVDQLYRDLEQLPKEKGNGPISCPIDLGVKYKLVFVNHGKRSMTAIANPSGSCTITINGSPREGMSTAGDRFFSDLSIAIGVPKEQLSGVFKNPIFVPIQANPSSVIIEKNEQVSQTSNRNILSSIVRKLNQAGQAKPGKIHCMAYTRDEYRITFLYANGQTRVFENHGGPCQPLVDMQNGYRFYCGDVFTDLNLIRAGSGKH